MSPLSIGTLRGLQQLADPGGIFSMCAMDHRGSLREMLSPGAPDRVGGGDLTAVKLDLVEALAPEATAVLLDPLYGHPSEALRVDQPEEHRPAICPLEP